MRPARRTAATAERSSAARRARPRQRWPRPQSARRRAAAPSARLYVADLGATRVRIQILTVDVGTGTQDVLLFDAERELENCFKLVLPSPTIVIADRIRRATAAGRRLVLTGVTMGGGPSHWATMDHVRQGLEAFATPEAARTFDDDLDAVGEMGIRIV